jgi:hypothetical protein
MQGAAISFLNDATFGSITNIGNAGNYEYATIQTVVGNDITFTSQLLNSYTPTGGSVQLITVPEYRNGVVVTGTLTAADWNGIVGGVLVFDATSISLQASIDVTGRGFRGGTNQGGSSESEKFSYRSPDNGRYNNSTNTLFLQCSSGNSIDNPTAWASVCGGAWRNVGNSGCGCTILVPDCINPLVVDPLTYTVGTNLTCIGYNLTLGPGSADKGEGLLPKLGWYSRGRGRLSNGGGGGNEHNGGGGGGSNFGLGGLGGKGLNTTASGGASTTAQGIGGINLNTYYTNNKIFMGGGGGAGQGNDGEAIIGSDGGGIILIRATSINNTGSFAIRANGENNNFVPTLPLTDGGGFDGSGGGGGGGCILLNITTYTNTLTIESRGGKGGDNYFTASGSDCYAPGGGGGGGVIWFNQGVTPPFIITNVNGGPAGVQLNPSSCVGTYGVSYGATAGSNGGVLFSLPNRESSIACTLPVEWLDIQIIAADEKAILKWVTDVDPYHLYFIVQRSANGLFWQNIDTIYYSNISTGIMTSQYIDDLPLRGVSYYRVLQKNSKAVDIISSIVTLENKSISFLLFPNPVGKENDIVYISKSDNIDYSIFLEIYTVTGTQISSEELFWDEKNAILQKSIKDLSEGIYFFVLSNSSIHKTFKVTIMR